MAWRLGDNGMSELSRDYQKDKSAVIEILGLQCSVVQIDDRLESGVRPDPENGILAVGSWQFGGNQAQSVLHEIGHLMITRDEAVGALAWGMESPNLLVVDDQIYNEGALGPAQIKHESRAWAWQWILSEACGLSAPSIQPPLRPEAHFLSYWHSIGNNDMERNAQVCQWQKEFRSVIELQYADPLQAVKNRIQNLGDLLEQRACLECVLESEPVIVEEFVRDDINAMLCLHENMGKKAWSVVLDSGAGDIQCATGTGDMARARRYLAQIVANNRLEPRSELSLSGY